MRRTDFHYDLPDELIARHPAPRRSDSRLLHLDGRTGALVDRQFRDLPRLLRAGDLLVFNDTRVIPARLHGRKATAAAGRDPARARHRRSRTALVQLRSSKPPRPGTVIALRAAATATVVGRDDDFWLLEFGSDAAARLRASRRDAVAALLAPRGRGRRPRALPDRVCARAGRRGGADRGPALRRRAARGVPAGRRGVRLRHAARRARARSSRCVSTTSREHRMHAELCRGAAPQPATRSLRAARAAGA